MTDDKESQSQADLRAEWEAMVEAGLRGGTMGDLLKHTEDRILRGPLMLAEDRPANISPCPRFGAPLLEGRPWHITAPVRGPDLAFANAQLLRDLKSGASAARVELGGLTLRNGSDVKRLFEGVYTDLIPISFTHPGKNPTQFIESLLSVSALHTAHINLGLHPDFDADAIAPFIEKMPQNWRAFTLASNVPSDTLSLALLAATTAAAMRRLPAQFVHDNITIEIATHQDAHMAIAKVRAARRIYATVAAGFGLKDATVPVQAVTSLDMMQRIDPWTNMLRVMSAGFGALVGGADYVLTRPFTDAIGHATPFGHRVARNMQLLMMEECHLGHVSDPAYGSYFHERMTEDLGQAAWAKFQSIEAAGGLSAYENSGELDKDIADARDAQKQASAPIVGVTLHPEENNRDAKVRGTF